MKKTTGDILSVTEIREKNSNITKVYAIHPFTLTASSTEGFLDNLTTGLPRRQTEAPRVR